VDGVGGGPILQFLNRLAEIFQDLAVEELNLTCSIHGTHEPGNAIDNQAKIEFACAQASSARTTTATAKAAKELRSPRVQGVSRSLPRCACADLRCACPCVSAFSSADKDG
jgi:hypothetical protein